MFQANELINLLIAAVTIPLTVVALRRVPASGRLPVIVGFAFMAVAYLATVVEGVVMHDVFNLVEHASYAAAGLTFAYGVAKTSAASGPRR